MKLIFILGLVATQAAFAGDKVGNGGGLWACENPQAQIQSAKMVDLFEAQTQFGLSISPEPGLMAQQIALKKTQQLKAVDAAITNKLGIYLDEVFHKTQFVNAALELVDDALYLIEPLPATCPAGAWKYVQFANFTAQNQVLIRNDIWISAAVSELDKGALLVHEAVYRWMRVAYSDTNSVRSRQIVGLLFSTLSPTEVSKKIQTLLGPSSEPGVLDTWACMLTNKNAEKSFLGFGKNPAAARFNVSQTCSEATSPFFCDQANANCEQATSNAEAWMCQVKNPNTSRSFAGNGRTTIEATYQAVKNCEDASDNGFFCHDPICTHN